MRNGLEVSLREMTPSAIVSRLLLKSFCPWKRTALPGMARQALAAIVGRCFLNAGFRMRAMAADAAQSSLTSLIAATQHHRRIMLQQVLIRGRLSPIRDPENPYRMVQGRSRTKVQIVLVGLEHPRVACLMAIHADVVGKPGLQA